MAQNNSLPETLLGRVVEVPDVYTPSLLQGVPRADVRESLGISQPLPFKGVDQWTAWEVSWLNKRGRPQVAVAQIQIGCESVAVVESKSLKLYLSSFNQTRFGSVSEVARTIELDLSVTVKAPVLVDMATPAQTAGRGVGALTGESLDALDIECEAYQPDSELLTADDGRLVSERLTTDLFRSRCPITGQPDWASILIAYYGPTMDRENLLRYLVSYRQHQAFHEACIERIFVDIQQHCRPQSLTVYGRFLRRGGLDINPLRSSVGEHLEPIRLARQ